MGLLESSTLAMYRFYVLVSTIGGNSIVHSTDQRVMSEVYYLASVLYGAFWDDNDNRMRVFSINTANHAN